MRRLSLVLLDLVLIALSTVAALLLRDNFEVSEARFEALIPYLLCTLFAAAVMLPALGSNRSIWRYSGMGDYLKLSIAVIATVALAVAGGFAVSRMEGVPRSLPILQAVLMMASLVGVRVFVRLRHYRRGRPTQLARPATATESVLLVGLNRVADLYLRSVQEFAPDQVKIAGVLGRGRQRGRAVNGHPVLGAPEHLADVLRDLEVHGIAVDRIVVTLPVAQLSSDAKDALAAVESTSTIRVDYIATSLGLDAALNRGDEGENHPLTFQVADRSALARRPYWRVKRALDATFAYLLLVVVSPLMVLVGIIVAIDVGLPLVFWQQRPGVGGYPFKLYKFRTMTAAHDGAGRGVPANERTSKIGHLLRRLRLDELPQLLQILAGEMSFVGPRPLLPVDQSPAYAARLLVRPGLTGWAQVMGGRTISPADKAALDVWYVHNASLALDLRILLATARMVLFGERVDRRAIARAWRDLQQRGVCASGALLARRDPVADAVTMVAKRAA